MHRENGLTLIEVLLALAILGIALTAVIHAVSQDIRQTSYLQQKTLATYVALEIINQIETGVRPPPTGGGILQGESSMAGQQWSWETREQATPSPDIKKILVTVFHEPEQARLANLTGYLYVPRQ